jgi:hypothetical protein
MSPHNPLAKVARPNVGQQSVTAGETATSSDAYWLYEYQKLTQNVLGWLQRGLSETSMQAIEELWQRWREGCSHDQR